MADAQKSLPCPKCPPDVRSELEFHPLAETKNMGMKVDGKWIEGFRAWQGTCPKCGWQTNIFMSME